MVGPLWGAVPEAAGEVRVASIPAATAATAVIETWSEMPLKAWPEQAKVRGPRVAWAKLIRGRDADVQAVQRYLRAAKPWAGMGSDWLGHRGDYDFTTITLVGLLHQFGDHPDRLTPETVKHLIEVLLPTTGGPGNTSVPGTGGLLRDTENHLLMIQISRYLTNQWRWTHTDVGDAAYDNRVNGLDAWLTAFLTELEHAGFHEFNAVPYEAYTLQALMTLEAFAAAQDLRDQARALLDGIVWRAALASDRARRTGPFRRQLRYLGDPGLKRHAANAMASVWADWPDEARRSSDRMVAAALPYRPPAASLAWFVDKPRDYFVRVGHGPSASPELVHGGPGHVLVAGGAGRGAGAKVVPRPTVLMVQDESLAITDCFHLAGRGDPLAWNNTGVHRRLACGPAGVDVPAGLTPVARSLQWRIYDNAGVRVAVHAQAGLGLLVVLPDDDRAKDSIGVRRWIERLHASNPDAANLRYRFRWPDGDLIEYDVDAPAGQWVIQAVGGQRVDRDYDRWSVTPTLPAPGR